MNAFNDAREFFDPESGSSSGATHVLDSTPTVLSSRTLPRFDSGLPRYTQNCTGIMGIVFERPPAQQRRSSTVQSISKNLASYSQELRPDTTGTARVQKRESLNKSIQSPHFQSRSEMLSHTGGTSFLTVVLLIIQELPLQN